MRERALKLVAVNITMHPHSPKAYVELLRTVSSTNLAVPTSAERLAWLKNADGWEFDAQKLSHTALIATTARFDAAGVWTDTTTGDVADEEEAAKVFIPANLAPNRREFRAMFFPESHILIVESKNEQGTLTARSVKKMLDAQFARPEIREAFGDVSVTIIPDKGSVQKILNGRIRKIVIRLTAPNSDETADDERDIAERLERLRAKLAEEKYVAKSHETIQPDDEMRKKVQVASRNGTVEATLLVEGQARRTKNVSTSNTPYIKSVIYRPLEEDEVNAFERGAVQMNEDQA